MPKLLEKDGLVLVKFNSHRARDRAMKLLTRKPQGYYSLRRETAKGVYAITPEELEIIKRANIKGGAQTYWSDDLHRTFSWK